MELKRFRVEGVTLAVMPDVPKWFALDDFGGQVLKGIIDRKTLAEIRLAFKPNEYQDVDATFYEIHELIDQAKQIRPVEVQKSLTTATTVAMISLTRDCNLKDICKHCYVDAKGAKSDEMTVSDHQRLATEIRATLCPNYDIHYKVALTGGEPFMVEDILAIIQAYNDENLGVGISTNGLLIKPHHADFLRQTSTSASISLDGATADVHEKMRGKGTFSRTVKVIEMLTGMGIRVGINSVIYDGNLHQLSDIISLAHELGCTGMNPINLVQLGRACQNKIKRASETEIFHIMSRHLEDHPDHLHLFHGTSMFSSLGSGIVAGISCFSCGIGHRPCVYVDSNGDIYPCANTQRPRFLLGNILSQPLADCVKDTHPVMEKLRTINIDGLNEKCSSCSLRKFCGGDCRGETENVTGDLHAPYVHCADRFRSILELMAIATRHPEFFSQKADEYITNAHL